MPTLAEVQENLANVVNDTVYPNGVNNPSITGGAVKIAIGYPIAEQLNRDVLNTTSQITIFPIGKSDKNTTRFQQKWHVISKNPQTLFATINKDEITLTGSITDEPQSVIVILNKSNYAYVTQMGDTLEDVALAVANLLPNATVSMGTHIIISGPILSLEVGIAVQGKLSKEIKRQRKIFYISIYAPTPAIRATLADALDLKLGEIERLNFDDLTQALVTYKATDQVDLYQKNILYKRDLIYDIEYPTMTYDTTTVVEAFNTTIN